MKYLISNLKSNKNLPEIIEYKKKIEKISLQNKIFILFPPSIYLPFFYDAKYKIGSQNISIYESGSHTGEILASQLASLHVSYTLINHCEVKETIESCILKIKNAYSSKIKVIYCVGKNTKEQEDSKDIIISQIKNIFEKLTKEEQENIIIAYEPCFVIHQNKIMDLNQLEKMIVAIKEFVQDKYHLKIPVIYGGSIQEKDIQNLLNIDILDGYLIGSGANNPENILKIAEKL